MLLDVEDFTQALSIISATEVKMPLTFGGVGKSSFSDTTQKVMTEIALQKECTFAHLVGRFYKDVSNFELNKILEALEVMQFFFYVFKNSQQLIVFNRDSKESSKFV
jgi:hypothetical protein